jgi:hypothetical protein
MTALTHLHRKPKPPAPQKHRWFDRWLAPKGDRLRSLVADVALQLERHERENKTRKRTRKVVDLANHRTRVETTVANLAYAVLVPPEPTGRLAVDASNDTEGMTRYDNRAFGKPFRELIRQLEELDVLTHAYPKAVRREKSSIAPTPAFAVRVRDAGIALSDFGRLPNEEVLILTRKTARAGDGPISRGIIDYKDTPNTDALRAEVRSINAHLAGANISFVDDGLLPAVDPQDRVLCRMFLLRPGEQEEVFDKNGRLFGGFWQNMKSDRRRHIRMNGEPVAELDYGSMFTRLAYAHIKKTPPHGDLYAVPDLADYRDGVKRAMNVLLFDDAPTRKSWPDEVKEQLPEGWGVAKTKSAILRHHPALKDAWCRALGYGLMFDESCVMIAVLNALMEEGVVGLPIHDALLVPASAREVGRKVMEEQALRLTRAVIPVAEKGI